MKYREGRSLIKTGDLLALKHKRGWIWALVRIITRSEYTHTATAVWLEEGLYAAEMSWSGNHLIPVSQYEVDFDVYTPPVGPRPQLAEAIYQRLRTRVPYGFIDLLWIVLYNLLHFKLPRDRGGLICSALSALIYKDVGWVPRGMPRIPSPAALIRALNAHPKIRVTRG
ncbi:MAG: hypothetical protein RPU39_00285 [Candidatus Sedimenticola sp. (ex Thyasira tokunagai)]